MVVTPSHHCQTVRMSGERQRALLSWAAESDNLIVEDDYEPPARIRPRCLAGVESIDERPRVLHRRLSKTLAPGLKASYVVAPREAIVALRRLRRLMLRRCKQQRTRWPLPLAGRFGRCNAGWATPIRCDSNCCARRWRKLLPAWQIEGRTALGHRYALRLPASLVGR